MTYVLTITVYLGAVSVSRELPNRFASLDQCRDYFAEYVKQLRHPPHAKVAFDASSAPEAGCWRARLWTLRWRRLPT
jgi:hypothetical protein